MADELPADLRKELACSASKEHRVIELLKLASRPLSLDELLISNYRKYNAVEKRHAIRSAVYRLLNKGIITSTSKGKYAIK